MNAKKLKALRKYVRKAMGDAPLRGHQEGPKHSVILPDYSAGLNPDGTVKVETFVYTGTVFNAPGTQRAAYRHAKKVLGAI